MLIQQELISRQYLNFNLHKDSITEIFCCFKKITNMDLTNMTLVNCRDCDKKVSKNAVSCPYCGSTKFDAFEEAKKNSW
jgi:4-hydroxy-3-methylbut-2-en-1-yl diphosphate synthase IspG/GcpE